jgi:hypothetical protein
LRTHGATPDRLLLGGLENLRAGEEATGRDVVVDERLVVAASVERSIVVRLAPQSVEGLEEILDLDRAVRNVDARGG